MTLPAVGADAPVIPDESAPVVASDEARLRDLATSLAVQRAFAAGASAALTLVGELLEDEAVAERIADLLSLDAIDAVDDESVEDFAGAQDVEEVAVVEARRRAMVRRSIEMAKDSLLVKVASQSGRARAIVSTFSEVCTALGLDDDFADRVLGTNVLELEEHALRWELGLPAVGEDAHAGH